jgi:RHS repeat-associated protein
VYYYFEDHLGTSRVIVQAGQNTACYEADFYPYGGERVVTNTCPQNYKFTGKERDSETQNDYFGARFYESNLGRFMSPDPENAGALASDPQSWNMYSYGRNNPLRYTDPTGKYEEDVHRDLTTVLALAAGFDAQAAVAIGNADQGIDEGSETEPFAGVGARRDYHFTTSERRDQMWASFEASGQSGDLGAFLHAEQDSYSHAGYGPGTGHMLAGHAPDKTYNDPGRADNMAKDTYGRLSAAAARLGIDPQNQVAWSRIAKLVGDFNKARTRDEKDKTLGQLRDVIKEARQEQQRQKKPKRQPTRRSSAGEAEGPPVRTE